MNLTKVHIENFKSIIDISINSPNPFTVFVGPNGSGKSNIFEAIQLATLSERFGSSKGLYKEWINIFGGYESIKPKFDFNNKSLTINIYEDSGDDFHFIDTFGSATRELPSSPIDSNSAFSKSLDKRLSLLKNCSRIFIGREKANKIPSSELLNSDASNLEIILKRILEDKSNREEITDWLKIFIPEFKNIEIHISSLSGSGELAIYEKKINAPLSKNLISDGTYNIISLLTAVYQNPNPQFLLIEEPENGLHPYVIKTLVDFFRQQCEEKGHTIWLNTHSQTLVDELKPNEIILVDKKDGRTQIKQFPPDTDLHGLKMDFAWLSNALGGGVPW